MSEQVCNIIELLYRRPYRRHRHRRVTDRAAVDTRVRLPTTRHVLFRTSPARIFMFETL